MHEFRTIRRPDGSAAVVYVPGESPSCGVLHASFWSHECEKVRDEHNAEREARIAAAEAGQRDLFAGVE